jgi:hypothetical protein
VRTLVLIAVALVTAVACSRWGTLASAQSSEERDLGGGVIRFEPAPDSGSGIYRVWSSPSTHVAQRPFSDYEALLTDRARQFRATYDRRDLPEQDCATGMPLAMLSPTAIEFIRGEGTITMRLMAHGVDRVIHMDDGSEGVPPPGRSAFGHSTGFWDHDVLVIETHQVDWPLFDRSGTPLSDQVEFIERFSVSADGSRLIYKLTTIDRVMFRGPLTSESHWDWLPAANIEPSACAPDQEK